MDQEDGEFIDCTVRFVQQVSKINEYKFLLAVMVVKPRQHFLTKDITQPLLSPDQRREEGGEEVTRWLRRGDGVRREVMKGNRG